MNLPDFANPHGSASKYSATPGMVYLGRERRNHGLVPSPTGPSWPTEHLLPAFPRCMTYPVWQLTQETSKCEPQNVIGTPACLSSLCRPMG